MCFFNRKKKQKELEAKRLAEQKAAEELRLKIEEEKRLVAQEEAKKKAELEAKHKQEEQTIEKQKVAEKEVKDKADKKKATTKKKAADKPKITPSGRYEIYPEVGLFKYRLKASNGEILLVSGGYTSRVGAQAGIDTLKKNMMVGNFQIVTDKNNFSQFRIYSANNVRLVASGEFYDKPTSAQKALDSVQKFAMTEKVVQLDEIPLDEMRDEVVTLKPVEKVSTGKIEVNKEGTKWRAVLKANNGELLFVTSDYATKANLLSGLEIIRKEVENGHFIVHRDKQNRFQYHLLAANGTPLIIGETYAKKDAVFSAIDSVRRFASSAVLVLTEDKK